MKKSNNSLLFIFSICCASLIALIFYFLNYVELEGFNPSDDGVILAQSFRLYNGEIPHLDFISIRPVFSGLLHGIHLISPFPVEISARWFVLFQYFTYSFLWVYLIFSVFRFDFLNNLTKGICFISLACFSFLLNLNNYNLYPWTTVDAIFISVTGLWIFYKSFSAGLSFNKQAVYRTAALFLFTLAAITRQNFILLSIAFFILVIIIYIKSKKYKILVPILLAGGLPVIIYLVYMLYNNAFGLFFAQMTGRTELFQTGVISFIKSFANSWLLPVHITALAGLLFILFKNNRHHIFNGIHVGSNYFKIVLNIFLIIYLFACIALSIILLVQPDLLFKCSFELFWISFILTLAGLFIIRPDLEKSVLMIFSVLIAWISAISLGDNSPVFSTGIIGSGIVGTFFLFNQNNRIFKSLSIPSKYITGLFPILVLFFILAVYGQRKFNYRDLPSSDLNRELGELVPGFGKIKTNNNTYDYYSDLNSVILQLGGIDSLRDKVVVVPNNSIFYPLFNTKNPFPLDWLQHEEYLGSENYLYSKIENVLKEEDIYLIIDKYDSKRMASGFNKINIGGEKYDYIDMVIKNCKQVNVKSELFFVLKSYQ